MRHPYLITFAVIALVGWGFFYLVGDFNEYVGDVYKDGRAWIKARAAPMDRVLWSLALAVLCAAIDTAILWALGKLTSGAKRTGNA